MERFNFFKKNLMTRVELNESYIVKYEKESELDTLIGKIAMNKNNDQVINLISLPKEVVKEILDFLPSNKSIRNFNLASRQCSVYVNDLKRYNLKQEAMKKKLLYAEKFKDRREYMLSKANHIGELISDQCFKLSLGFGFILCFLLLSAFPGCDDIKECMDKEGAIVRKIEAGIKNMEHPPLTFKDKETWCLISLISISTLIAYLSKNFHLQVAERLSDFINYLELKAKKLPSLSI